MSSERLDWVEIIEPRTKDLCYVNLTSGEFAWDPPKGVTIKRADPSQWWELFDKNTQRFYYYNFASQITVWHRPKNCDIIPLTKLQKLQENTVPNERKDGYTQTAQAKFTARLFRELESRESTRNNSDGGGTSEREQYQRQHSAPGQARPGSGQESRSTELLASPQGRYSYRLPSCNDATSIRPDSHKYCRHTQDSRISGGVATSKQQDSSKSSDSSISSAHGYRRLQDGSGGGGSLRIGNSHQQRKQHSMDSSYRQLQESSSSHNIPHVVVPPPAVGGGERSSGADLKMLPHYPHQALSYSLSNSSDLAGSGSPGHSSSTPQFKKKFSTSSSAANNRETPSANIVSLTRSGSFMSPSATKRHEPQRSGSIDGNGASDDSMHEKYFKSVENTPISRRRHNTVSSKPTSASVTTANKSPQSPTSPSHHHSTNNTKSTRPSHQMNESIISSHHQQQHQKDPELFNLDLTTKPERYLDKMKIEKGKISPGSSLNQSQQSSGGINHQSLSKKVNNKNSLPPSSSSSQQLPKEFISSNSSLLSQKDIFLTKPNLERHNKEATTVERTTSMSHSHQHSSRHKKKHSNTSSSTKEHHHNLPRGGVVGGGGASDVEYDNGNISPLYTNWDQEMQEHLLPLQHYIIEQAKLSGCYGLSGEQLDSDSLHSDSQSEHSFSGHEPDNEDSDHSDDDRGDYLAHNYVVDDEYGVHRGGVAYYNVDYDKNNEKEDISQEVENQLENAKDDQIYSPVKNHPFFQLQPPSSSTLIKKPPTLPFNDTNQKSANKPYHFPFPKLSSLTSLPGPPGQLAIMKECDIEKFAQDNLNLHSKGIFRKKSSVRDMLSWTSNAISRPMLALSRDKTFKKMACELFKLLQIYMGDRKARAGMSLNSVAIDIITMAVATQPLRDELYVQLCRQTTENPMRESLMRGWELLAICLSFIPPSPTFQPALLNYMNRHRDPTFATTFPEVGKWPIHVQISHYATISCRRLDRIGSSGKKQAKKATEDEVNQSRDQIFRDSMFGNKLMEVIELQRERFPERQLPWIQVTLSEQVLLLAGKQTEGIFRVPADIDEVTYLKSRLDRWEVPEHKSTMDAHTPASLLKLWYRELYDPLIPDELYNECVETDNPDEAAIIINKLPRINRLVLTYLIHFLQQFSLPDVVLLTKMDASNLAMVFAPNCLRCTSNDPKVLLENARKEMTFLRTLITNMDTSSVAYTV